MNIRELKQNIVNNTLQDDFLVFVCPENTFVADQYITGLSDKRRKIINKLTSLAETTMSALSLVIDYSDYINVLRVDEFSEYSDNYAQYHNCFVICSKVDPKIKEAVSKYVVDFPKLTDWQVKAYIKAVCPALEDSYIDWLYKSTKGDIYRISNELDKIKLYPTDQQLQVATALQYEPGTDLFTMSPFDLSNAIIANDKRAVLDYLWHKSACDIDPFSIIGLLLGNFKKVLLIKHGSGLSAEELGISPAQYNYLRKSATKSERYLTEVIEFLSEIDYRLKSGNLEMSRSSMIDYIICRVMSFNG